MKTVKNESGAIYIVTDEYYEKYKTDVTLADDVVAGEVDIPTIYAEPETVPAAVVEVVEEQQVIEVKEVKKGRGK